MNSKIRALALFVLTTTCVAQETPKFNPTIAVNVSANDAIKGEITSFISRELRQLGDVTVTDQDPTWELQIVGMEAYLKSGPKSGFVISVVIFQHFKGSIFDILPDKKQAEGLKKFTAGLVSYPDHWIRSGSTDELKQVCQGIVADFDAKHLDPSRSQFKAFLKQVEGMRQSQKE